MKGDNPRHHPPGMGVLYIVLLPFIVIGVIRLIVKKIYSSWILLYWLLLAPVASALAVDAPNASRSLVFLPVWEIFAAVGIITVSRISKNSNVQKGIVGVVSVALFLNVVYYAYNYFFHTNRENGSYWQYGYKEAVDAAKQHDNADKKIYFSEDVEQAYIFYLFHNAYDPALYLQNGGSSNITQKCYEIENAYFGSCTEKLKKGDIVITTKENIALSTVLLKDIQHLNGVVAIRIREVQ
jgi:hypothetical protein